MTPRTSALLASIAAAVLTCIAAATPSRAADIQLTPVVADVLWPPQPVRGSDSQVHLVYELRLSNPTPFAIAVDTIEVLDETGRVVLAMDKDAIGKRLSIGGRRGAEATSLSPGQFGVLFMHAALPPNQPAPRSLSHRVLAALVQPDQPARPVAMTIGETRVAEHDLPVLGPPLVGEGYVAADGCCDSIRHVRALLPIDGRFALAQRFAIDWEQLDADRRVVRGDVKKVESYIIFGTDVIAVADGTVVAMRNDLPEQVPGALPPGLPIDQADGNFVVLDIGRGAFALFAHMQPGSVTVQPGATVKRGDVLGKVGNTGNSQAPHLHFHVMDGPSPLLANGIPYVIDRFRLTAVGAGGTADFDKAEATGSPMTLKAIADKPQLERLLPMDLSVVDFSR
ncbi:M23 family metallopeptidase [Reyranella sp.]|uniref:M23 family metallopeptidase n=1 Tax=Reyranella sp. TaxID=1929291 RepID=UPI003D13E953